MRLLDRTGRILIGLFAASIVVGWLCFDSRLARIGDNAEFIVLAQSLLQGEGLSYINGPAPQTATKYPPGFPVILTIPELASPGNTDLMKSLIILFFGLVVALTWLLVRDIDSEEMAWLVSGAVLLSPSLIEFSHLILSEIPYTAFSMFALIVLIRTRAMEENWRAILWITSAVVASYYVRTIGVALLAGAVVHQFLEGRYRRGIMLIGACALLVLPWMAQSGNYVDQLVHVDPYQTDTSLLVSVGSILHRINVNVTQYGLTHLPGTILPSFDFDSSASVFVRGLAVLVDLLVIGFIATRFRRAGQSPICVYLLFYLGVVLLWPEVWGDVRFIVPIIPLMLYAVLRSLSDLIRLVPVQPRVIRVSWVTLSALVLASNAWGAWERFDEPRPVHPAWRNYFAAAEWIRLNSDRDDVVACRKPFLMHVMSGRKTVGYPWSAPPVILNAFQMQSVDYVVVDAMFGSTQQFLVPAIEQYQEMFRVADTYDNPPTVVFELLGASSQSDSDVQEGTVASLRKAREAALRKSVEENPEDDVAQYGLAYVLIQQTRFTEALAVLTPLVERMGDVPKYRVGLVVALVGSGRLQDAQSQLGILAARYPDEVRRDDEIGRGVRGLAEAVAGKLGVTAESVLRGTSAR